MSPVSMPGGQATATAPGTVPAQGLQAFERAPEDPPATEPRLAVAGWWATVLAVGAVPVLFVRLGTSPFDLAKVTLLWVCTVLGAAGVLSAWLGGARRPRVPAVAVPLVALIVAVAVATAASTRPWVSLMGRYGRYQGLVSILTYAVFAAVVFVQCSSRPGRLRVLALALGASGVIGAGYLVMQVMHADFDWSTTIGAQDSGRYMGALGNSNLAGAHLAIVMPVLVFLRATEQSRRLRVVAVAAMALVGWGLWISGSRGAWIAAVVGVSVATLADRRFAPRWLAAAVTLLAIVGAASVVIVAMGRGPSGERAYESPSVLRRQTLEQRADIWAVSAALARDHPLVGTGPDTFAQEVLPYVGDSPDLTRRPPSLDAPHNIALAYAVGAGLPALVAWLVLVVTTWVVALNRRVEVGPARAGLVAAFGGAFAAYLAQGMLSIDAVPLAFLGWVMGAAMTAASCVPDGGEVTLWRRVPRHLTCLVSAVTVCAAAVALLPFVADVRMQRALASSADRRAHDPIEYLGALEDATVTNPTEPRLWYEAARQSQVDSDQISNRDGRLTLLHGAMGFADRSLDLEPGEVETLLVKAKVLERLALLGEPGRFDQANELYRRIEAGDPYDPQVRIDHARLLATWGRDSSRPDLYDAARAQLGVFETLPHTWSGGWFQAAKLYLDLGDRARALDAAKRAAELDPVDWRIQGLVRELSG